MQTIPLADRHIAAQLVERISDLVDKFFLYFIAEMIIARVYDLDYDASAMPIYLCCAD